MASPFLAGFPSGLMQAQQFNADQQYRQTLAAMAQQRMIEMRRQALLEQQKNSLLGRYSSGLFSQPAGGNPFGQQAPDYSPGAVQQTPPQPGGVPDLFSMPTNAALNLIARDESGGRNIPNYRFDPTHTASGPLQITDSTWNRYAESVGAPKLSYPASPKDRPLAEQYKVGGAIYKNEGFAPWANYNPKLASDLKALPDEYRQAGSSIAINTAGMLPPQMIGKAGPGVFAQLVQRIAGADAPDEVKGAALAELLPLMSREGQEQFQQQWEMFKFGRLEAQHSEDVAERHADRRLQMEQSRELAEERMDQQRQSLQQNLALRREMYGLSDESEGSAKAVPDKWEGMPDKAPPGIPQDVWNGALAYAQTGQMPSLGMAPGLRNQILHVSPAAMQALGMRPSEAPQKWAEYGGQKHAEFALGTRVANLSTSIFEAEQAAPVVIQTSKNVPRTDFGPFFNRWVTGAQLQSGDPNIVQFQAALNTFLNVYSRGINPTGRMTDQQQRHAYETLSTAMSQGQIEKGVEQLNYELQIMKQGLSQAVREVPEYFRPGGPPVTGGGGGGGHKYSVGQVIEQDGKKYVVTGGDLDDDPDVKEDQ